MLPISIGISRCLIGDAVRYDGTDKYSKLCRSQLSANFDLNSICPEVESGLSIPREPIELIQYSNKLKVLGRDDSSIDVTGQLLNFLNHKVPLLTLLSGFILTPRSPSCGLNTVVIKSPEGQVLSRSSNGLFVSSLIKNFPTLPLIEEPDLAEEGVLSLFQLRVIVYYLIRQEKLFARELFDKPIYWELVTNLHGDDSKNNQMMALNQRLDEMTNVQVTKLLRVLKESLNDK